MTQGTPPESAPRSRRGPSGLFRRLYGAGPAHLVVMLTGLALAWATVRVLGVDALWNPQVWWQSIAVWFAAAVVVHDLVLFPAYALLDRIGHGAARRTRLPPGAINHLRVPALASGLAFLLFAPTILERGGPAYLAATGGSQEVYLGRWLAFTAAAFGASALWALCAAVRAGTLRR